jgi:hypothetical protein
MRRSCADALNIPQRKTSATTIKPRIKPHLSIVISRAARALKMAAIKMHAIASAAMMVTWASLVIVSSPSARARHIAMN